MKLLNQFKRGRPHWEEELRDAALFGLLKAARTYNPERSKFTTYCHLVVHRSLIRKRRVLQRREWRLKGVPSVEFSASGQAVREYEDRLREQGASYAEADWGEMAAYLKITQPEEQFLREKIVDRETFITIGSRQNVNPRTLAYRYQILLKRLRKRGLRWHC
jgi:DNA-directed RNA polymerase specialized sigma subunit